MEDGTEGHFALPGVHYRFTGYWLEGFRNYHVYQLKIGETMMTEQKAFVTVCADCGVPGKTSEIPDGKTYFYCCACGGSRMTTIDVTDSINLLLKENKS